MGISFYVLMLSQIENGVTPILNCLNCPNLSILCAASCGDYEGQDKIGKNEEHKYINARFV